MKLTLGKAGASSHRIKRPRPGWRAQSSPQPNDCILLGVMRLPRHPLPIPELSPFLPFSLRSPARRAWKALSSRDLRLRAGPGADQIRASKECDDFVTSILDRLSAPFLSIYQHQDKSDLPLRFLDHIDGLEG